MAGLGGGVVLGVRLGLGGFFFFLKWPVRLLNFLPFFAVPWGFFFIFFFFFFFSLVSASWRGWVRWCFWW